MQVLGDASGPLNVAEICERITTATGPVPRSSVQSYLSLNTPGPVREGRARAVPECDEQQGRRCRSSSRPKKHVLTHTGRGNATLFHAEALHWARRA